MSAGIPYFIYTSGHLPSEMKMCFNFQKVRSAGFLKNIYRSVKFVKIALRSFTHSEKVNYYQSLS